MELWSFLCWCLRLYRLLIRYTENCANEDDEIISALERIEELAKKNIEMTTPIKPYLINLVDSKNKEIGNLAKNVSKIFERAAKNKEIAKNRKIMREKEKDFLAGKIKAEEYAKLMKEYLTLKG